MHHDRLILIMRALGYSKAFDKGVCFGFAMMCTQAACNNQLKKFFQRLKFLERFRENPDSIVQALECARLKVSKREPLSADDEQILEIPAFFDGISLYQGLHYHRELENTVNNQFLYNNMGNQFLNMEFISSWVQPQAAENRLHKVSCAGQYTELEFSQFLTKLASALEGRKGVGVIVGNPTHAVSMHYKGNGMFELVEINVDTIHPTTPLTPEECADYLFNYSFDYDLHHDKLLLRTTAFATNPPNLPDLSFEHQKKYTTLHTNQNKISLLELALVTDDLDLWKQINLNDIPFKELNENTRNALFKAACLQGQEIMVRLFLQQGINLLHPKLKRGGWFATVEHPQIMSLLLQHGMDPNTLHPQGVSPLQSAVTRKKPEIAKLLISYGADIRNATNTLHLAASQGQQEMVKILVSYYPQAGTKDNNHLRPLDYAAAKGHHALFTELLPHTPMQPIDFYRLYKQTDSQDKDLNKYILIEGLSRYIKQRQQEFKPLSTFFSHFGCGYAEREKVQVATKVLELLKTNANQLELEPREIQVLNNGRLQWLYRAVNEYLKTVEYSLNASVPVVRQSL